MCATIGDKRFFIGGRAIFTVVPSSEFLGNNPDCKPHYTFYVRLREANDHYPDQYFINLLTGPDNTSDYTYIGKLLTHDGSVRLTKGSKLGENTLPVRIVRRVLSAFWQGQQSRITEAGWEVMHEGKCCRCGRALTNPESVRSGIGPECAKRG